MRKLNIKGLLFCLSTILVIGSFVLSSSPKVHAATSYEGIAIKKTVNIYEGKSRGSAVLKSYTEGSILKFSQHTSEWYSTGVIINGKKKPGYLHRDDVERAHPGKDSLTGVALQNSTAVYGVANGNSKALKTYAEGSILKYRDYSSKWYTTSVFIKGKRTSGYIRKTDVDTGTLKPQSLRGIALQNQTTVYANASTSGKALKSYPMGSILKYHTYSKDWYKTSVYVNGKKKTGYIYRNHVENAVSTQQSLKGIGLQNPTTIYANASTGSKKLKSYSQGSLLSYKTFSKNWYETGVYINGKKNVGYIHKSHVEDAVNAGKALEGIGLKSSTNVYQRASKQSPILKGYPKGSYLKFRTFSPNWYQAQVYVNGKKVTGYIHSADVDTSRVIYETVNYKTSFSDAVKIQMQQNPKPQVYGPNGKWIDASQTQVEYYINSSNFSKGSREYYQFLKLSQSAGLNAREVNSKILNNKGILKGQAQAFIDAGKKFGINEAYLISHALLETGNGTSALAKGIPVDAKGNIVNKDDKVYTVYNMYGVRAYDSCPEECGAKHAFEQGWFTPEDAIIGGAEFINTYIARGQDTLYKMKWNPISPGYPQYATDIAWATKQTTRIKNIYDTLDHYVLYFEIPRYVNQPAKSGNPDAFPKMLFSRAALFANIAPELEGEEDISLPEVPRIEVDEDTTSETPGEEVEEDATTETPEVEVEEDSTTETPEVEVEEDSATETPEVEVDEDSTTETPEVEVGEDSASETPEAEVDEDATSETPEAEVDEDATTETPEAEVDEDATTETPEVEVDEDSTSDSSEDMDDHVYNVEGAIAMTLEQIQMYSTNDVQSESVLELEESVEVEVKEIDGDWYFIHYEDNEGWVQAEYVQLENVLEVVTDEAMLYTELNVDDKAVYVEEGMLVVVATDEHGEVIQSNEWYQILFENQAYWVNKKEVDIKKANEK